MNDFAPSILTLRICQSCGRDDRWNHLRDRHRPTHGSPRAVTGPNKGLCPGPVRTVFYRRETA